MARQLTFDVILFSTVIVLSLAGLVLVYSSSAVIAMENLGNSLFFLMRQIIWLAIGLTGMTVAMKTDYRILSTPYIVYGLLGLSFLMLAATLFSKPINGTKRWILLGPMSVQPSEFVKIILIVFVAYYLNKNTGKMDRLFRVFFPVMCIAGFYLLLIVIQPDLGTAVTISMVLLLMFFLGGMPWHHSAAIVVAAVLMVSMLIFAADYRMDRIMTFMNPEEEPLGRGFQISQSLIAVGTGGVFGLGLAEGKQKLFFLPEPHTDFIYSVLCEEFGFTGAVIILAGFLIILWRGMKASFNAPDGFGGLLAGGLTLSIVLQAMINIGVSLSLLPTKGISLPFISYGGSSLVCTLVSAGIILSVSQHAG